MKKRLGLIAASLVGLGVAAHAQPVAAPAAIAPPSAEQLDLAARLLEATNARANAKALTNKMLSPAIADLNRDYPHSGIAEWSTRYADRQADAQYRQTLAGLAQTDVRQLRSMLDSIGTKEGKAALAALEGGDLSGQAALSGAIDDTPAVRSKIRLELLQGACAQIACPPAATREIARASNRQ